MPRRISDYPDAFAGWNLVSSFGSIISVVATWVFLNLVYHQLVEGKPVSRYPWLTPQFYTDLLQSLLSRSYNSLEWALNSPPKPHAFVSLPLQSGISLKDLTNKYESLIYTSLFCLSVNIMFYILLKWPFKFLASELGMLHFYFLIGGVIAILYAITIADLCHRERLTKTRMVFTGIIASCVIWAVYYFLGENSELVNFIVGLPTGKVRLDFSGFIQYAHFSPDLNSSNSRVKNGKLLNPLNLAFFCKKKTNKKKK